ncbi:AAA family ATPase [Clostridium sp.]|uniref:McrB family protein n=1 Tax=Clostridium sp. TaxID=1506 RepID=UPI00284B1F50|nr:AAA family ATPase [Clostridium sp.]MDR3597712.1 AAA family ATPase [Clostridium sp.]
MEYILPEDKDHLGILIKYIKLKGKQFVGKDQIKGKNSEKLQPDDYVSEPYILHDLIRGIYKPKGWECMLSYLATEKEENYGKQIIWNNRSDYDFQKIILQSPNGEKDNRKVSDINAAKYAMDHKIPIGILLNEGKGINRCLGLGLIDSMDIDNNFNIIPLNLDEKEMESVVNNMNTNNNFFTFRSNDPDDVSKILDENTEELEISRISNYFEETEIGDKVLFVLGGDKPNWKLGLRCICTIISKPHSRGYDESKPKYYKVRLKKELLLEDSISREEMVPYRDLYNMIFIGPMLKGEPNQINVKTNIDQVISVIRAIIDKYSNAKDELVRIFGKEMIDKALKVENILVSKSEIEKQSTTVEKVDSSELEKEDLIAIQEYINSKGFIYSYEDLCNFYLSLKTKPFVILAGISGTGKSKLVKLFAEAMCAESKNGQYNLISVKPDWNDSTELLGYKNLNDEFVKGKLTEIMIEASKEENKNKPYFICLDEMNLARVEYYLSEYLSLIETRSINENGNVITDLIFPKSLSLDDSLKDLIIPDNVYVVGTVNMDDTTFSFSRKVLDRANTIEFSNIKLENLNFEEEDLIRFVGFNDILRTRFINIKDALKVDKEFVEKINKKIIELYDILKLGNKQFGYRVRDEIVFYMLENKLANLLSEETAFDFQIMQKILPTISGSDLAIKNILIELYNYCNPSNEIADGIDYIAEALKGLDKAQYKKSAEKIIMMLRGYEDGFTSFWL